MRKRGGLSWWSSLGWGRRAADDGADFGDMGTAFGLDASLAGDTDLGGLAADGIAEPEALLSPTDRLKRRSSF